MSEAVVKHQFQLATDIHQLCLLKIVEVYRQDGHWGFGAADVDKIITELEKEIIQEVMDWSKCRGWEPVDQEDRSHDVVKNIKLEPETPAAAEEDDTPVEKDEIWLDSRYVEQHAPDEGDTKAEDIEDGEEEELPPPAPPITPPKPPGPRKVKSHKEGGKATATASIVLRSRIQALLDEGCSIATLAEKAKLSDMTVRNILGGSNPRAVTYDKIADALDRLGA